MRHVWTVVCTNAVIDRYTNSVSLLNVLEQITIQGELPEAAVLPIGVDVLTLWSREVPGTPETSSSRLTFRTSEGEILATHESDVQLTDSERLRARVSFQGLPLKGPGTYYFNVEIRDPSNTEYKRVAEVPLVIEVANPKK
jgi:hypothetical protein